MSDIPAPKGLPDEVAAIRARGFAVWSTKDLAPEFMHKFDEGNIPVVAIRHVRQWGLQVDDERELMGHERTSIPDEELWQVVLRATDGSTYEINSELVQPAPV